MNWNEWRKFCSENGLSLDQASESWTNYKNMTSIAQDAALAGFSSDDIMDEDWRTDEEYNPVEEILEAKEQLADLFTGEAMLEQDAIELFEKADKVSEDLLTSLKEIKSKRDYHDHMAKMLTQEAKDMVQEIIKEVRRAF